MEEGAKRPPLPKICHTYPTMIKVGKVIPYLKTKSYISHVTHTLDYTNISIFLLEIRKFCYIKKYRHRFHLDTWFIILLTFLESLRVVLINIATILMMSAKIATPGLLKTKPSWKKKLWRHNFCSWRHQQNFIMWLKL